jgi:ATP-dependent protease ClpP protease subunit
MHDGTQARAGAEIALRGEVGASGFTPEAVAAHLRGARGPVTIAIHSYGGDAMSGVAIHNIISGYRSGQRTVIIEGVAASAASLVAMAGDRILMPANSLLMIHEAWGSVTGNAGDLAKRAALLETVSAAYRRTYAARSGKTEDEVAALMAAETWFTADQALAAGFADEVIPARAVAAIAGAEAALRRFINIPAAAAALLKESNIMADSVSPYEVPATIAQVRDIAARARLGADWVLAQVEAAATLEAVRDAAIDAVAAQPHNAPMRTPLITVGASYDAPVAISTRASEALAARVTGRPLSEEAREYAGASIAEVARAVLAASNHRLPLRATPATVIQAALTTSDFPQLLRDTMQRVLQDQLAVAPGAARVVCAQREAPDFREGRFLQFASIEDLSQIPEGGAIPHSPPAERGESFAVKTWARGSRWTRQALVNDDLGALDTMRLFANAIVATEASAFTVMFAANGAGWGPTLRDGLPLFHASHNNVASGTVGTTGISAGRVVMRGQTDASGNLIAAEPRILLVGPQGETAAEQALNGTAIVTTESALPVFANRLQLAVEPRLSGAPWFMFADPAVAPMLAMVTLAGSGGMPRITEHETASFDGLEWKVTHDFVIAPMTFVGGVRVTGV